MHAMIVHEHFTSSTTDAAKVWNAVEDELERSDVNDWLRLNWRPRVPSLDVGGFVDAVVVEVAGAAVEAIVALGATVGVAVALGAAVGPAVALGAAVGAAEVLAAAEVMGIVGTDIGVTVDLLIPVTTKFRLL